MYTNISVTFPGSCEGDPNVNTAASMLIPEQLVDPAMISNGQMLDPSADLTEQQQLIIAQQQLMLQQMQYASMQYAGKTLMLINVIGVLINITLVVCNIYIYIYIYQYYILFTYIYSPRSA